MPPTIDNSKDYNDLSLNKDNNTATPLTCPLPDGEKRKMDLTDKCKDVNYDVSSQSYV